MRSPPQLRRRQIRPLVCCDIATNLGIEPTARAAYERGYDQDFAEDAMTGLAAGADPFSATTVLPQLGLVRSTADMRPAIGAQ